MPDQAKLVLLKFVTSGTASAAAETATFPLDLTKTRLQIQGEVTSNSHARVVSKNGMFRTVIGVVNQEGVFRLWRGVQPAVYRHLIYSSIRIVAYEQFREFLGRSIDGSFPVWKAALSGAMAGAVGQFFASPMDLVKVRMQMEYHGIRKGSAPRYKSVPHALRKAFECGGLRSLWAGWVPSVQRAALVNLGNLATYDIAKQKLLKSTSLKDNWVCHTCASAMSGFMAAVLSTPADVVKTRVMNQARHKNGCGLRYRSSVECLIKTVHQEGLHSLYKGFIPIWTRIAPWSVIFWITNEELRKVFGISTF